MIPTACKRLAEVDFPIAEVSRHAAREKSIRHGHPSTLHLWWARRPLASSRAVLMALLLPDPCDLHCPEAFKAEARRILLAMDGRPQGWASSVETDEGLRQTILKFVADFANWDNAANDAYLDTSRALVKAAHGGEPPLVVDPFAGGGSIPLEALRLGCDAFASDLNPVACLILKVMLEDIPRHGPGLAEELRKAGNEIKEAVENELADLYPTDPDGATPIAWLWARTVRCEAPDCGAEIPLMRSFWLAKKGLFRRERGRRIKVRGRQALRYRIERPDGGAPRVALEVFEPAADREVPTGTVTRAKATCPCCGAVLPPERVRAQLSAERGGAEVIFDEDGNRIAGARMTAVVTLRPDEKGRHYRLPTDTDYAPLRNAQKKFARRSRQKLPNGMSVTPNEPTPVGGGSGAGRAFGLWTYGVKTFIDFHNTRQVMALERFCDLLRDGRFGEEIVLAIGKLVDLANAFCEWEPIAECPRHVLSNGRIKPSWDFVEGVPTGESSGSFLVCVNNLARGMESIDSVKEIGSLHLLAAQASSLADESAGIWFTDPPYYDAIPYSDLSDFCFVWLRRALAESPLLQDPFDSTNPLTPKNSELVQDETRMGDGRVKDRTFFEEGMAAAFAEGRRILCEDGIGSVVFAHKTTEGWEALLSGMIRGGWTITGSWPIATEMATRLRARDSAALATSVHLVCRPRSDDAPIGDWADVLHELPERVGDWMERLQEEGIRGADLVFACVGPALEIFSRYRAVETAEGREVGLADYLEKVWEVVGRAALGQVLGTAEARARNGLAGALEEDARLTALFLWTLQSTEAPATSSEADDEDEEDAAKAAAKGLSLPFDVVRRFAQPMGIDLDRWTGRIVGQHKGAVRLLPVAERAKALFGEGGARTAAEWIERDPHADVQPALFPDWNAGPKPPRRGRGGTVVLDGGAELQAPDATTLDRVHAAMLLQSSGHARALRALIAAEQERGPDFLRLANALSALYPRISQEKRLLDAMLLAVPR